MKPVAHFQMNDRMIKLTSSRQIRLQHKYLGLPGEVEQRYPTEVVLPNMDSGRIDELYSVNLGLMIDLEEESSVVTEKTLKKCYKYRVFSSYIYCKSVETVVLCKKDPKNFPKEYKATNSDILRPTYIYFPPEELWEKYENLINKIEHKEVLSEFEAMDMMVIPKYLPKNDAAFATESIANYFKDAIIEDEELKRDISAVLSALIIRDISDVDKQDKLLEMVDMSKFIEDVKWAFKEEFEEIEQEKNTLKQENVMIKKENDTLKQENVMIKKEKDTLKEGIKKLNKNKKIPPEIKNIINSTLLVK